MASFPIIRWYPKSINISFLTPLLIEQIVIYQSLVVGRRTIKDKTRFVWSVSKNKTQKMRMVFRTLSWWCPLYLMLSTVAVGDSYLVLVHLFWEKSQFAICNNNSNNCFTLVYNVWSMVVTWTSVRCTQNVSPCEHSSEEHKLNINRIPCSNTKSICSWTNSPGRVGMLLRDPGAYSSSHCPCPYQDVMGSTTGASRKNIQYKRQWSIGWRREKGRGSLGIRSKK